jgi:hypothetical protein
VPVRADRASEALHGRMNKHADNVPLQKREQKYKDEYLCANAEP